jgi:hypothetical protein
MPSSPGSAAIVDVPRRQPGHFALSLSSAAAFATHFRAHLQGTNTKLRGHAPAQLSEVKPFWAEPA